MLLGHTVAQSLVWAVCWRLMVLPHWSIYDIPAPELPCQPNTVQKLRTSLFEMCNTSMHASRVCKKTLGSSAPGKSTTFQFIQILASRDYITLLEQCNDNVATEDVSLSNLLSATCHTCQQYKEHPKHAFSPISLDRENKWAVLLQAACYLPHQYFLYFFIYETLRLAWATWLRASSPPTLQIVDTASSQRWPI
jgi:hypothetical protein